MANPMLGYWYKLYMGQTPCETLLEKEVCKLGIRYRTQHPFLAQRAFADFYFPDFQLIVEVDDPSHERKSKIKKDLQRTKSLEALGLRVIRFTNAQIRTQLKEVITVITANTTGGSPQVGSPDNAATRASSSIETSPRHPAEDAPPTRARRARGKASLRGIPSPRRKGSTASR